MTIYARFFHGDPLLRIDYTPGTTQTCGAIVNLGGCAGVVTSSEGIVAGVLGSVVLAGGVWKLPKAVSGGITFARGSIVAWDDSAKKAVPPDSISAAEAGDVVFGICTLAAVDADAEVQVYLCPGVKGGLTAAPAALVDNSGGAAADGTIAAVAVPTDTPASADALRDDIATNMVPAINNAVKELATKINAIRTALVAAGVLQVP